MERIDIQCDAKSVWEKASEIVYQTIQYYETELCGNIKQYFEICEWNKNRIKPFKFTSRVGFYKNDLKGIVVFITKYNKWWHTIPTEPQKATLVIYLPKLFKMISELRKEKYNLKSDEERNL